MGGVFGNKADPQYYRGAGALDYYVPAYCGLVWTAVGLLALPVHLARYREDGVLRRLRASAARPSVVLGAQLLVTFGISLVGSALMIAMAALAYDIHAPRSLAGFFGAWLLCGALFSALGVLLASIPSSRGALSAGLGLFFTMMMLAGAGPPPEVLTGAMHWVSNLLPLTYMRPCRRRGRLRPGHRAGARRRPGPGPAPGRMGGAGAGARFAVQALPAAARLVHLRLRCRPSAFWERLDALIAA